MAVRAAPCFFIAVGAGIDRSVLRLAWNQCLRKPVALEQAKISDLHRALVPEHDKISAVPVVSTDDPGAGDALLGGGRRLHTALAAACAGLRQGADVLLSAAYSAHSSARRCSLLRALRACVLDV